MKFCICLHNSFAYNHYDSLGISSWSILPCKRLLNLLRVLQTKTKEKTSFDGRATEHLIKKNWITSRARQFGDTERHLHRTVY